MTTQGLPDILREALDVFTGPERETPLTTTEVADQLNIGRRSTYNRLDRLVDHGHLKTKKVGARGRIWWHPHPDDEIKHGDSGGTTQVRQLKRYKQIIETVNDGVYTVDSEGYFTLVNRAYAEMMGYSREELLGAHVSKIVGEETIETAHNIEQKLMTGDRETATFETDIQTADEALIRVEGSFTLLQDESGEYERIGVVRDITERTERERELERYTKIIDAVGEPVYELDAQGRITFVNEPLVERVGYEEEELLGQHVSIGIDEEVIARAESKIAGLLGDKPVGTTTLEYELVTKDGERIPVENQISLLTDEEGMIRGSAGVVWEMSERIERERKLIRQREQLTAVNNLNAVVHDITDAAIEQSTREEIETIVCEQLAAMDSYQFAWIGDADNYTKTVNLRTEAGVEGYLDDITISVDPADERNNGPIGRAILQREVQTAQDVLGDASYQPWCDSAREYGFRSSAAIPIEYEESLYGVLNVYSARANAFTTGELERIGRLGEIVGHAIASVERKRALMSDEVIELEFQLQNIFEALDADATTDSRITLDGAVPTSDGTYLVYGTTTADGLTGLEAVLDQLSHWDSITVLDDGDDTVQFEVLLTEPPILSAVASQGGYVDMARIENGNFDLRLHLAPSGDARAMTDTVLEKYPGAELRSQRQITRTDDAAPRLQQVVHENLTDRQQASLEAAYNAGFFEWPRTSSGEDVADSLGISPPTFHQHLRKAEYRVFTALLETSMVSS
jgi:HTH-type transcriptional regulator, bacterioopsin transcriptional activator and related proteins